MGEFWGLSRYPVYACDVKSARDGVTGQNRTFPDIGVMQIAYGGLEDKDRLKAELRTGTLSVNSEGAIHLSKSCWPGLNAWSERNSMGNAEF